MHLRNLESLEICVIEGVRRMRHAMKSHESPRLDVPLI